MFARVVVATWLVAVALVGRAAAKPCQGKDIYEAKGDGVDFSSVNLHHCRKLDLRYQGVDDEGAQVLGEAIADNKFLQHLNLGYGNNINLAGIRGFSKGLAKNKHLKWLHL